MRIPSILLMSMLILAGCAIICKPKPIDIVATSVNDFLERPFGHEETPEAFRASLPDRTHTQKLIHRVGEDIQTADTIYYFKYRKSKIATYVTQQGQTFVIGGHVVNHLIPLVNGIRIGMDRERFHSAFTDLPQSNSDTIKLVHPTSERTFNFYFSKNKIYRYTFSGE